MAKNVRTLVEEIALPIVEEMSLDYVDTEYIKQGQEWMLTIYIDKPEGVLLDDCEAVSRAVEAILDEQDFIQETYCLCVSSPGLDRPLKTVRDFKRSIGKMVDVKIYKAFEGKKEFTGVLTDYSEDSITIDTEENEMTFELKETAKISLHLDI